MSEEYIPATDKQMAYAEDIADELGIDLPLVRSVSEISMFIEDNKDDYYESRRERMGGYGEMENRIDRRMSKEVHYDAKHDSYYSFQC